VSDLPRGFLNPALAGLVPYEPGKPVEEVQRELGIERVVKLASNESPFGPFPTALEALGRSLRELNRYPDGGAFRLRSALAERHGVRFEEVAVGGGSDGVVDCISQAVLVPGDEVVLGWPSFPSYAIYATKLGAAARRTPLTDHRYDLDAMLAAVGPRTKLVYVPNPNNPTGTMSTRDELDAFLDRLPGHVLPVLDEAYFEYVEDPDYPDGIEEYFKRGRRVVVLRTFSKIYGLAALRVGYAVAPGALVRELAKVRRPFDVAQPAQEAALASLDCAAEVERRRSHNREGRAGLARILAEHGLPPVGPAVANFLFAEVGGDAVPLFERLLAAGAVVRPLAAFGAPGAIRVTVGTHEEQAFFARALEQVVASAAR
jgi:histidinol-phosphate aminotransferase